MFGIDDIMIAATIAGTATQAFGAIGGYNAKKKLTEDEIAAEENKRHLMETMSLFEKRQIIRNRQMAQATAEANATQSGANFGSAAGGARGQIQGQAGENLLKNYTQLAAGEKNFNLNEAIAKDRAAVGDMAGIQSLGQSISGMGGGLGRIFGGSPSAAGQPMGSGSSAGAGLDSNGTGLTDTYNYGYM